MLFEKGLNGSAKSIHPYQLAWTAHAGMGGNFSPLNNFLHVKRSVCVETELIIENDEFRGYINMLRVARHHARKKRI